MGMTKPPKYRGHRKGYAEIWLGESVVPQLFLSRFYMWKNGIWSWDWSDMMRHDFYHYDGPIESVDELKVIDSFAGRETIFLGYIRED